MSSYISGYLIIFIPLLFSVLCYLISFPKSDFIISIFTKSLVFLLLVGLITDLLIHEKIVSNLDLVTLSIPTEYSIDLLGAFFMIMIVFIKIMVDFFYKSDIEKILKGESKQLFYAVDLLNLFGLIGIFTTNNILNLYVFIEIYSFTFYAIMSMSNDLSLTKLAFRYFSSGVVGSLLLLISFLSLYLITGQVSLNLILGDMGYLLEANGTIAGIIFLLTTIAIVLKFFPVWLYFEKVKSNNFMANFLSISSLFIKINVGIYLIIRLVFFLFGTNFSFSGLGFDVALVLFGTVLTFYGNIKMLKHNHLKIITSYLCLTNLGLILIGIAVARKESVAASFLYIANYSFINLLIFFFASYLSRNFLNCNIRYLHIIRKSHLIASIPLKIMIFFIVAFPLTVMFLANWNLAYSAMDMDFYIFILIPLITTNFASVKLAIKMINNFYFHDVNEEEILQKSKKLSPQSNLLYLISFWIILSIAVCFALGAEILSGITSNLSVYILSNTL